MGSCLWNMVEAGRLPTSSPCYLLSSLPHRLKGIQKPYSSSRALPFSLDSQGLTQWHWTALAPDLYSICSQF